MYAPEDAGRLCNMGHYQSPNMVRDCFRSSEPPSLVFRTGRSDPGIYPGKSEGVGSEIPGSYTRTDPRVEENWGADA